MSKSSAAVSGREEAKSYQEKGDLSAFEGEQAEQVEVRRNVTISVRFSEDEMKLLRARAEAAGGKVTAYIRAAALQQSAPLDRFRLIRTLEAASANLATAERLLRE